MFVQFKAQSAIEYLMTYGWMLVVVAIVGGSVFSTIGDQNIESVTGFNSNDVVIEDFGVSQSGLMFSMKDFIGDTEVSQIQVSASDSQNISYTLNQEVSENNLINLPGIRPSSQNNELDVDIIYDTNNLQNISASGQVTGNLEIDDSFHDKELILEGLQGYWPLKADYSESNTVYDLSSNQNHGIIFDDVEENSEVTITDNYVEHRNNGFTRIPYGEGIEAIQNPHTYLFRYRREGDHTESNMFFTQSSWSNNERMYIGDDEGRFGIGVASSSWSEAGDEIEGGEWYSMAFVLDGEQATLYADGEYQNSKEYVYYADTVYEIVEEAVEEDYAGRIRTTGDGEDKYGAFSIEAELSDVDEISFWYEANQIDYEWAYPAVNISEQRVWEDDYTSEEDNDGYSPDWTEVIIDASEFDGEHQISFRLEDEGTGWDDRWVTFDNINIGELTYQNEDDFENLQASFNSPVPEPMVFDMNLNMGNPVDYSTGYSGNNSITELKIYDRALSEEEIELIQQNYEAE